MCQEERTYTIDDGGHHLQQPILMTTSAEIFTVKETSAALNMESTLGLDPFDLEQHYNPSSPGGTGVRTLTLLTPKDREYFLLTFLLMFTILIVMFIAWRVKRLLSFLSASITTTTVCSVVPLLFMSYSSCLYREYYENTIHYVNGFLQLKIFNMCFLPVCLLLRLLITNWPIYLYTFTLLGSPFIFFFGLGGYLDILLTLQDVERSNRLFQTLQLHMFAYIVITFSGIWILIASVEMYVSRGYWRCWKWTSHVFEEEISADLEKASIDGDDNNETISIDEPPEFSSRIENRKIVSKSHTTTRLVKFSHQWTIDEFIRCDHRADAPKFIDSVHFASPDNEEMKLFLRLYPRGRHVSTAATGNRLGESAVSLYLHYLPSSTVKEVTIGFVCSIIDKSGAKCDLHERRELFSSEQDAHGWDNFIYRSTLLNSRFLLPGEKLTINCEVSYAIDDLFTFESIV